jgi:hypothetical protein
MRHPSNILTLDALVVVLSRSQVTLELSMSMRIRPICKSLHIHTYTLSLFISSKPSATAGHSAMLTAFVSPEVQRLMAPIAQARPCFSAHTAPLPITWPRSTGARFACVQGRPDRCGQCRLAALGKESTMVLIYADMYGACAPHPPSVDKDHPESALVRNPQLSPSAWPLPLTYSHPGCSAQTPLSLYLASPC